MRKVLVLEDEENIRSFVVINLKRAGYTTIEAGTGEDALAALKELGWSRVTFRDMEGTALDNDRRLERRLCTLWVSSGKGR